MQQKRSNLKIVKSVADNIDENYCEDIVLELMTNKVYISPNYLSKLFEQYYGISFNKCLLKKRLNVAEMMLMTGDIKVHDISDRVVYVNLNCFTKILKQYKGYSPSQYRRHIEAWNLSENE